MRLLLIRHGHGAPVRRGGLFGREDVVAWRAQYDATGIDPRSTPPAGRVAEVARADRLATSDLRRAVESLERLAGDRPRLVLPLLRETQLPIPRLPLRMPFTLWNVAIHARWIADILRHRESLPEARRQVEEAAAWCRDEARSLGDGTLAAVTHGVFRRLLAIELEREGWRLESRAGAFGYWSVWRLRGGR